MNKKIIIGCVVIAVIILLVTLLFFSGEGAGVPLQQLEEDLADYDFGTPVNPKFKHDVDRTLHTDTVTVEFDIEYKYGVCHKVAVFEYFYDKSTDVWELQDRDVISNEYELNERISSATFSGTAGTWQKVYYDIAVKNVDYQNCGVTFSYSFKLGDKYGNGIATLGYGDQYESSCTVKVGSSFIDVYFSMDGIRVYY